MLDFQSLVKYLLEGLAVAVAAFYIPRKTVDLKEIGLIALTAAAVFAILDQFATSVGQSARQGAGFGIGLQQVGYGYPENYEDYASVPAEQFYEGEVMTEGETFEGEVPAEVSAEGFEGETSAEVPAEGYDDYTESFSDKQYKVPDEGYPDVCNDKCEYNEFATQHQKDRSLCHKKDGKCMVVRPCKIVDDECQINPVVKDHKDVAGHKCQRSGDVCRLIKKDSDKEKFTEGFEDGALTDDPVVPETFEDEIQGFEGFTKTF